MCVLSNIVEIRLITIPTDRLGAKLACLVKARIWIGGEVNALKDPFGVGSGRNPTIRIRTLD